MEPQKTYLKIGFAPDLSGPDRVLYRALETVPGVLAWSTLLGIVAVSYIAPVAASFFIILFDIYWLVKTIFLSIHLRANVKRMRKNTATDWYAALETLEWRHLWQLVILPMSHESLQVVRDSVEAIAAASWPKDRTIVVLSYEGRFREHGKNIADAILREYRDQFPFFMATEHPDGLHGEIPGKGSNESWAARRAKETFIDPKQIPYKHIITSSFDIDTRVQPQYFDIVAVHFLNAKDPIQASYQPVPVYNNNIWDAPALSRVVASSGTFWQMMQQERPERLTTFSSHSMSFQTLVNLGYWQTNVVSEDSRIFWNALLYYDGDYTSIPLSFPVSLDANLASTFWQTMKNVYKQQRRWAWGAENFPYVAFGFIKNKNISAGRKFKYIFMMLEGYWSWSTNALMIFALGWLPIFLGGAKFNTLVLAYNLPLVTRTIMTFAMVGMVTSAIVSMQLLPPRPQIYGKRRAWIMALQWVLVPFTIIFFGSLPAIEAQTRLMLGKYMGFWITPKHRSNPK